MERQNSTLLDNALIILLEENRLLGGRVICLVFLYFPSTSDYAAWIWPFCGWHFAKKFQE